LKKNKEKAKEEHFEGLVSLTDILSIWPNLREKGPTICGRPRREAAVSAKLSIPGIVCDISKENTKVKTRYMKDLKELA